LSELLSGKQRRFLRARAHALRPVVAVGNAGVTPALLSEIDNSLEHHELLKIKIASNEREERELIGVMICAELGCEPIAQIGKILVVYRCAAEPRLALPPA
jgi:RNA-binding protein